MIAMSVSALASRNNAWAMACTASAANCFFLRGNVVKTGGAKAGQNPEHAPKPTPRFLGGKP